MRISLITLALVAVAFVWLAHQIHRHPHTPFEQTLPSFSSSSVGAIETLRR